MHSNICFFNMQYKITTGFFSENTIILAEGEMLLDGVFEVSLCFLSIGHIIVSFLRLLMGPDNLGSHIDHYLLFLLRAYEYPISYGLLFPCLLCS